MERRIDRCLELCRHWAEGRVATGNEPPWAWYQYMKLIETVSAIQTSRAAVPTSETKPATRERPAPSRPKRDPIADIGAQRRRRSRDDDDDDGTPPLPM